MSFVICLLVTSPSRGMEALWRLPLSGNNMVQVMHIRIEWIRFGEVVMCFPILIWKERVVKNVVLG